MEEPDPTKRRIMIVDDHPLICRGLAQIINAEPDLCVCGTSDDAAPAMRLIAETKPDAVIVDLSLKHSSGLELIKAVGDRYPKVKTIVYSMHDESIYAERTLHAGARGYIMKEHPPEIIIDAIRKVLDGKYFFSDSILANIIDRLSQAHASPAGPGLDVLTNRELEIFTLIGSELSCAKIAKKLNISVKTVEAHRENIRKKLGFSNVQELKRAAQSLYKA